MTFASLCGYPDDPAIRDWGRTEYRAALEAQKALVRRRLEDAIPDTLVFTEHAPVFTVGMRRGADRHLVWDAAERARRGIDLARTNRGGDVTYHGPGQMVVYPIVSLRAERDLHAYLRRLESVVIGALARFGLEAGRRDGMTGIWIGHRKICAIGVAVRSWIAYHGIALNRDPDLTHFGGIVPCGIADGTVTSLRRELGRAVPAEPLKSAFAVEFRRIFRKATPQYG